MSRPTDEHSYGFSVEEDAAHLIHIRHMKWVLEWWEKDEQARMIAATSDSWVRLVCGELGTSHRNLYKSAELVEQYPPVLRSPEYSPRQHASWLRKDKAAQQ